MRNKFTRLPHREQKMLAAVLFFIIASLAYLLLWLPVNDSLQDQRVQYNSALRTFSVVEDIAAQIQEIQQQTTSSTRAMNLSGLVNDSLQARQLEITRLQQLTSEQIQIRLDNVGFNDVLAWLYDLENTPGIIVAELAVRPANTDQPGLVNITVGLNRLQ